MRRSLGGGKLKRKVAIPHFPFDTIKGREAVARVLAAVPDHARTVFHVLKLLYLAERDALRLYGRPIIGGAYWSLHDGPVLSPVYDIIKGKRNEARANVAGAPEWDQYIGRHGAFGLSLISPPPARRLSEADAKIIDDVLARHGSKDFKELWRVVHDPTKVPEYHDPGKGRSEPIEMSEMLVALGYDAAQIVAAMAEIDELAHESAGRSATRD